MRFPICSSEIRLQQRFENFHELISMSKHIYAISGSWIWKPPCDRNGAYHALMILICQRI